jgi:hypothetical protein
MNSVPHMKLANAAKHLPALVALSACVFVVAITQKPNAQPAKVLPPAPPVTAPVTNLATVFPLPPATLSSVVPVAQHVPPTTPISFTLADLKAQCPESPDGSLSMEIPMICFSANDPAARNVVNGKTITTTAQVSIDRTPRSQGKGLLLSRQLIRCCASDAQTYTVQTITGDSVGEFSNGSWVKVVGELSYETNGDRCSPVIMATNVSSINPPLFGQLRRTEK